VEHFEKDSFVRYLLFSLALLSYLILVGCDDGEGDDSPSGGEKNDSPADPCADPSISTDEDGNLVVIANATQNYRFSSTLEAVTVPVGSLGDIVFDWSDITVDMLGREFDPLTSVDMMEVMLWRLSKEALLGGINSDDLHTSDLMALGYIDTQNAMRSGNFFEVSSPGGSPQPEEVLLEYVDTTLFPQDRHTYIVMVAEGSVYGRGTKMLAFFEPTPDETNTEVRLDNDSATLTYTVDITSSQPIPLPAGNPDVVLDWIDEDLALGTNAMGAEWTPNRITDVMITHYESMTLEELEADFLDLELNADEIWTVFLSAGQSVNLSLLENENGERFSGIDETGVWIVALICGACMNPAPWFLAVLHPCA
jgi:hypothetical protein